MVTPFNKPIPGQSLTAEPKNAPYERPPEIVDPEEALMFHISKLNDADRLNATVELVEEGFDVRTLTEGILRNAVMNGVHSIDVSLVIAPAIHEFIASTLDTLSIPYKDGFENKEAAALYKKPTKRNTKLMEVAGEVQKEQGYTKEDMESPAREDTAEAEVIQGEGGTVFEVVSEEEPAPKESGGLMKRRGK